MVLAQKQKYRQMEQDKEPRNIPMHLWVPYFYDILHLINGFGHSFKSYKIILKIENIFYKIIF